MVSPSPAVSRSLVVAAGGLVWEACKLELGVGAGLSWFLFLLAGVFFFSKCWDIKPTFYNPLALTASFCIPRVGHTAAFR